MASIVSKVLSKLPKRKRRYKKFDSTLETSGVDLTSYDLSNRNLRDKSFVRSNLEAVNMSNANLRDA